MGFEQGSDEEIVGPDEFLNNLFNYYDRNSK